MHYSSVAKVCALSMGVIVLSTTLAYFILAWTNPTAQAPNGNTEAPINVSSSDQSKTGSLSIGTGLNYWITKNGDSFVLKNNAGAEKLIVGQDGNTTINGQVKITGGSPANGKVLTSDANGSAAWQTPAPGGGLAGNGTVGYISKFTGSTALGNSLIVDDGANIGIGTTTPGAKLDVNGQIRVSGGNPGVGKVLTSDANGLATWQTVSGTILPAGTSGQTLRHDGTNWIANNIIFNDGSNVGIGTTAPMAKLEVNGNLLVDNQVKIVGGNPGTGKVLTSDANGLATWQTLGPGITPNTCPSGQVIKGVNSSGQIVCGTQVTPATCPAGKIMTGIDSSGSIICDVVPCAASTCSALGYNCGSWPNGCGGTLNCGICGSSQVCSVGHCAVSCTPTTCGALGWVCGKPSDGCGGTLNCGSCGGGKTCVNGACNDIDCKRQSPGKNIFVTNNVYSGSQVRTDNAADTICGNAASSAGLPGSYKALAYLGARQPNTVLASGSFYNGQYTGSSCNWIKVANGAADFAISLLAPIRYDASGNDPGSITVWTGFATGGGSYKLLSLPANCCGVADQYGSAPACWPCIAGDTTVTQTCPPGTALFNLPVPTAKAYYGSNTSSSNWTGVEWQQADSPNCSYGGFNCKQPISGMSNCMGSTRALYCVEQ